MLQARSGAVGTRLAARPRLGDVHPSGRRWRRRRRGRATARDARHRLLLGQQLCDADATRASAAALQESTSEAGAGVGTLDAQSRAQRQRKARHRAGTRLSGARAAGLCGDGARGARQAASKMAAMPRGFASVASAAHHGGFRQHKRHAQAHLARGVGSRDAQRKQRHDRAEKQRGGAATVASHLRRERGGA